MKQISRALLWAAVLALSSNASTVTLNPKDGALFGQPGQPVGWGFTIQDSVSWVTVVGTDFCSSFTVGTDVFPCDMAHTIPNGAYTDFSFNFVDSQPSSMGPPDPSQENFSYNPPCGAAGPCTGTGAFTIDSNTPAGTLLSGVIVVDYNKWDGDPANGGTQQPGEFFAMANASVLVVSQVVPEPGTLSLMGAALAGVVLWRRRVRATDKIV
jgi:PEP-CTERM motif